jgi:DNA-directed RNA polymerase II subunit RPB2
MKNEPDIIVSIAKGKKYIFSFGQTFIPKACNIQDRENVDIFPRQAREKNLDYSTVVYVDITETWKEDDEVTSVRFFPKVPICRIPVMTGSSVCTLSSLTEKEKVREGECFRDPGGYFIIRGIERVLIAQVRNAYNEILTTSYKKSNDTKFIFSSRVRSMSEQTGHSVLVQAKMGSDDRNIVFSLPYISQGIPVGIVFKALGFTEESEIIDLIGLKQDKTLEYVQYILRDSYHVETKEDALCYMRNFIVYSANSKDATTKEKQIKYVEQILDSEIFPHMGIDSTPLQKALFLGHMVNRLITTYTGLRNEDSKDNCGNKRFETSGILLSELFRTLFKRYIKTLHEQFSKRQDDLIAQIQKNSVLTTGLKTSMTSSSWGVPKNTYVRTGVSQVLSRLSYQAFLSHLRRIGIYVGESDTNTKLRQIHQSQYGAICPTETPEGKTVGTVLSFTLLARVTRRFPTVQIKTILEKSDLILGVDEVESYEYSIYTKVFLNGDLHGYTANWKEFIKEIKDWREEGSFDENVSVYYEDIDNEVHILSDEGRIIRPLFPVKDGKLLVQKSDGNNWKQLIRDKKIVYIDVAETQTCNIAMYESEICDFHDYCEIDPSFMLGICASCIPFPDHNPAPRNTFQAAMGKQAIGIPVSSYNIRADTMLHVLAYPQKPFVSTKAAKFMGMSEMPSGINAIVAVLTYGGWNQEDSIILNKTSIQRGLFIAYTYKTITGESKKCKNNYHSETIEFPEPAIQRRELNYSYLDKKTGIIKHRIQVEKNGKIYNQEVRLKKGDVIIGKVVIEGDKNGGEKRVDGSYSIKLGEEGVVDKVITSTTPGGYTLVKVVIRTERIPEIGDKFAARSAQKGTCGMVMDQTDMPFTSEGIVPDIIINPHCIPSRMTIGQLLETVLGKCCAIDGGEGDATPFGSASVGIASKICDKLQSLGYDGTGEEEMYNGMTGEPLNARVFIGPTYYQRLKHMVSDKMHARAGGKRTVMHHQPLEGRSKDGGLRFGEMERDCMLAHGSVSFIKDRLFDVSDPYSITVCKKCGQITQSTTECKSCCDDEVTTVNFPYAAKQLVHSLQAMGIKMDLIPSEV